MTIMAMAPLTANSQWLGELLVAMPEGLSHMPSDAQLLANYPAISLPFMNVPFHQKASNLMLPPLYITNNPTEQKS